MAWGLKLDEIHTWAFLPNFLTPEECDKIIAIGNKKKKKEAKIGIDRTDSKIRKNKIAWLSSENDELTWLFQKLTDSVTILNNQYFKFDLWGFSEGLQFTEYNAPDEHYQQHTDRIYGHGIRKLSIVIQLSDPKTYKGGELSMYVSSKPDIMKKEKGTLIIFPSFVLHKVSPVTKGTRYSLVAWVTGKPFK